uniref:MULE transposase domain-containing protein n=1 Tax=Ditylenchus dipsaci TaxID=166011 RepID=A0A915CVU2_9BILA
MLSLRDGHNHLADPVETKKKIVEQRAKQAVCDNPHQSCRIAMNEAMRGMEEPVIAAINLTALRKSLEFRKRKLHRYPRGKTDAANLEIPDEWKSYDNGDPFLIYDSGRDSPSRFIILSSLFMLEKLVNVKTFAMDGKFKTRPRKWEQIFAIHVLVNGRFVPAVAVIMSKRGRSSYLYVLQRLTTYMEETFQVVWRPELVLTDFEVAQRSAIHQHFPGARHKCCFFSNKRFEALMARTSLVG